MKEDDEEDEEYGKICENHACLPHVIFSLHAVTFWHVLYLDVQTLKFPCVWL